MKRIFACIAFIAALASTPILSCAAEPSLATQQQLDAVIAKQFPGFKPCAFWEHEHLGLRCIYDARHKIMRAENMLYVSASILDDGLTIIQVGDLAYLVPSETN